MLILEYMIYNLYVLYAFCIVIICILDFLITIILISYIAEKQNITIDKDDAHEHPLLFGHSRLETMINTNDNCSDMKCVDNISIHNLALKYYNHWLSNKTSRILFTFLSREILLFCYIYDMIICTLSHTYDPSKHSYAS